MNITNTDFEAYKHLLHLEDFDPTEFKQLQKNYEIDKGRPDDLFVQKLLVKVTNQDFELLNTFGKMTPNMMAFCLNALKWIQGQQIPLTLGLVNVLSPPDADYLEYDSFRENAFLQYTKYSPDDHEFLALVLYMHKLQRWICTVQQPDYFEGMVVDFSDDQRTNQAKLNDDVMQLCSESFEIEMNPENYKILNFDQRTRYRKTDFGSYVFTYLYKFFHSKDVMKTKFIDEELMELGQNRLIWMLLRIRMFERNPDKIESESKALIAKKKKLIEMEPEDLNQLRELEFGKYTDESKIPQIEKYTDKEFKRLKKKFLKKNYNQTNVMLEKMDVQVLAYDFESLEKANFITPKLMQFLTSYLDVNDKVKLDKGIFFAQVNVLSTPEDDYFEYDLLRIDKDLGGKIDVTKDNYCIIMIYYKYKWAFALYDFTDKTGAIVDFKMDDNQSFDDTVTDLADIFKVEFNISVDDFSIKPELQKIKENGDAGVNVLHYLYRFLTVRRLNDIKFDERDKKLFKPKVEWLVLKFWELYEKEEDERKANEEKIKKEKQKQEELAEQEELRRKAEEEEEELRKQVRNQRAKELRDLKNGGKYPPYNFSMETKEVETQTHPFKKLSDTEPQVILSLNPAEINSRQQTLFTKQNPQFSQQTIDGNLDRIKSIDPETLKKVPLGIDDLENSELENVLKELQAKKPEELDMENKLFELVMLLQDPKKLNDLKGKNSNLDKYIQLLKQHLIPKQPQKKGVKSAQFSDLWFGQDDGRTNGKTLQEVIRDSLKDNNTKRERLVQKHKNPQISTSWYFLEMTKRGTQDPQNKDILDDIIHNKTPINTDNQYLNFMRQDFKTPQDKQHNYLEQLHFHQKQKSENFYKDRDMLDKIKQDFNADLKRSMFNGTENNREMYQSHVQNKNYNAFQDQKQQMQAQIVNSALSKSYQNPQKSNLYNVSSLHNLGKALVNQRQTEEDRKLQLKIAQDKNVVQDYQQNIYDNLSLKQMQDLKDKHEGDIFQSKKRIVSYKKDAQKRTLQKVQQSANLLKPQLENPVALRYNISLLNNEIMQVLTHELVTEKVFNFCLNFINEKHLKTTTEKTRLLNYTRILFTPTEFFQTMDMQDYDKKSYQKAIEFVKQGGNLLQKFDYMFVPIYRGENKKSSLIVVDLINKALVYYHIIKQEDRVMHKATENKYLNRITKFFEHYFMTQYSIDFSSFQWKYMNGVNSRTQDANKTSFLILLFASFLTRGNFVFQGVTETLIRSVKENMVKVMQTIGINNVAPIEDFSNLPL